MNRCVTSRVLLAGLVAGLASVYGCVGGKPLASGPPDSGGGSASDGAAGSTSTGAGGTSDGAAGSTNTGAGGGAAGNPPPISGAGGNMGCGVAQGPGSGNGCNSVVAAGPCVNETSVLGTSPSSLGGVVVAGTYELTFSVFFDYAGGTDQIVGKKTIVISNVTASSFTLDEVDVLGDRTDRSHDTVTVSGTTLTFVPTCPGPSTAGGESGSAGFTTTATSFTLLFTQNAAVGTLVEFYSKV